MPYWVHLTGKHPKLIENARKYNKKGKTGEITAFFYMVYTLKWPDFSHFSLLQVIAVDFVTFVDKYC